MVIKTLNNVKNNAKSVLKILRKSLCLVFTRFSQYFFYFTWGGRCEKNFGKKKELTRRKRQKKRVNRR